MDFHCFTRTNSNLVGLELEHTGNVKTPNRTSKLRSENLKTRLNRIESDGRTEYPDLTFDLFSVFGVLGEASGISGVHLAGIECSLFFCLRCERHETRAISMCH